MRGDGGRRRGASARLVHESRNLFELREGHPCLRRTLTLSCQAWSLLEIQDIVLKTIGDVKCETLAAHGFEVVDERTAGAPILTAFSGNSPSYSENSEGLIKGTDGLMSMERTMDSLTKGNVESQEFLGRVASTGRLTQPL